MYVGTMAVATALAPLLLLHQWLAALTGSALIILQHASYALSAGPFRLQQLPSKVCSPQLLWCLQYSNHGTACAGGMAASAMALPAGLCARTTEVQRRLAARCADECPSSCPQLSCRRSAIAPRAQRRHVRPAGSRKTFSWESSQLQWSAQANGAYGESVACSVSSSSAYSCAWCSLLD